MRAIAIALVGLSGLLGCFSSPSTVGVGEGPGGGPGGCVGASCKHGNSGGAGGSTSKTGGSTGSGSSEASSGGAGASSGSSSNGSGGSSSGGTSSAAGSSSSSSGGGGDQLFTCDQTQAYTGDGGFLCGDGGWYASKLIDLETCNPLGGVAVQAIGANGVPISGSSATSDATTGAFTLCVPAQVPVTMSFNLATYPEAYYAESLGTELLDWIGMLDTNVITSVTDFVPGGVDLSLGIVAVFFSTRATGCPIDDWVVSFQLPDGGAVPDGGANLIYMDANSIPDLKLTATSGSGIAILYNIDTTTTNYFEVVPTALDAGACSVENAAQGYTGRVYVSGGAVTYEIFDLAP